MIQISPTMRILVAIEPVDLRKGIDGLAQFCREKLTADIFWMPIHLSQPARHGNQSIGL